MKNHSGSVRKRRDYDIKHKAHVLFAVCADRTH